MEQELKRITRIDYKKNPSKIYMGQQLFQRQIYWDACWWLHTDIRKNVGKG